MAMGDSGSSGASSVHVSVSFGRFENEPLSWKKCSAFPTNKYLDEVEKCSTRGLVAQKKAYFEAHYKKIAARKVAEQQQHQLNKGYGASDLLDSKGNDQAGKYSMSELNDVQQKTIVNELEVGTSVVGDEVVGSTSERSGARINQPMDISHEREESGHLLADDKSCCELNSATLHEFGRAVKGEVSSGSEKRHSLIDKPNCAVNIATESKDLLRPSQDAQDESCGITIGQDLEKSEEAILIKEEALVTGPQELVESPSRFLLSREDASQDMEEKVILGNSSRCPKANLAKVGTNLASAKKKAVSPIPKPPLISNPMLLKPALSKSAIFESKALSKKKTCVYSLVDKKSATRMENNRMVPTSLHVYLGLDPANSTSTPGSVSRKSSIIEKWAKTAITGRVFSFNVHVMKEKGGLEHN